LEGRISGGTEHDTSSFLIPWRSGAWQSREGLIFVDGTECGNCVGQIQSCRREDQDWWIEGGDGQGGVGHLGPR
jgi:hypothetical protein